MNGDSYATAQVPGGIRNCLMIVVEPLTSIVLYCVCSNELLHGSINIGLEQRKLCPDWVGGVR